MKTEDMQRARYVGRGVELPCPLQVPHSPSTSVCSPTWKLSKLRTIGILMKASPCSHDRLITPFPASLPSLEKWEWDF